MPTAAPAPLRLDRFHRDAWRFSPALMAAHLTRDDADPYQVPAHIAYLASRIAKAVARGNARIIVSMPPRHGKSELISHWLPVWLFHLQPSLRVLLASYEASIAQEWGRAVRNSIAEYGPELGVEVAGDSAAADRWRTTAKGGMWTAGAGGPFTGRGGELLIIDDPHKNFQDAHSPTMRQHVWDWYRSTARSRLHTGGSIIVVQTRWHEEDLAGRLLAASESGEGEKFEHIILPALAEEADELGRAPGDALWPENYDEDALAAIRKASGTYIWTGLYQQQPSTPEGSLVKRSWWKWYHQGPDRLSFEDWVISWDMAFKAVEESSFVVGQVWAKRGADRFLMDQVRERMDFPETRAAVKLLAQRWPQATRILVEDKANGPAIMSDLKHTVPGLIPVPAEGSKESRVHQVSGIIEAGNVYLPDVSLAPWVPEFVQEWSDFPNAANDDQVDAAVHALRYWAQGAAGGVGGYKPAAAMSRHR